MTGICKRIFLVLALVLVQFVIVANTSSSDVYAYPSCLPELNHLGPMPGPFGSGDTASHNFSLKLSGNVLQPGSTYKFYTSLQPTVNGEKIAEVKATVSGGSRVVEMSTSNPGAFTPGRHYLHVTGPGVSLCTFHSYKVDDSLACGGYSIVQQRDYGAGSQICYGGANAGNQCIDPQFDLTVYVDGLTEGGLPYANGKVDIKLDGPLAGGGAQVETETTDANGNASPAGFKIFRAGEHTITVEEKVKLGPDSNFCKFSFTVGTKGSCEGICEEDPVIHQGSSGTLAGITQFELCEQIEDPALKDKCQSCYEGTGDSEGVWTAIGCIDQDPTEIAKTFVSLGLGIGGGIALLMILAAGFLFSVSQGSPDKTKQAKELLTAAITGLLFIIFSVMMLQFIGYDLLKIPGFGV